MAVERVPGGSSLIDVLDRVLDKGIVIDTYLKYSEAVGLTGFRSRELAAPSNLQIEMDRANAENAELRRKLESLS